MLENENVIEKCAHRELLIWELKNNTTKPRRLSQN